MTMEEKVAKLMEMGIPQDEARVALQKSGNDLNEAVGYIYGNEPSPSDPEPPTYDQDNLAVTAYKQTIPDYNLYLPENYNSNVQTTTKIAIDDDVKSRIAGYGYMPDAPINDDNDYLMAGSEVPTYFIDDDIPENTVYDIFDDINRTKLQDGYPKALIPDNPSMLESYFAPLLMILANVSKFRNLVLKSSSDSDYGFAAHWWKKDKCLTDTTIQLEVQRYLAFLTGDSKRSFASIRNLTDATQKLIKEEYDSVSEFLSFILDSLVSLFGVDDLHEPINSLLVSKYYSPGYDVEQNCKCFTFESSSVDNDLYKTMHASIWGKDLEELGKRRFDTISDIVTICLEGTGDGLQSGFSLSEKVYFQVYTKECEDLVVEKKNELEKVKEEIAKLNGQTMILRAYNGKKVANLLDNTIDYLSQVSDGSEDIRNAEDEISSIKTRIVEYRQERTQRFLELNQVRNKIDLYNIDSILSDSKLELEPSLLVGVIVNEANFFYLDQISKKWLYFQYELENGKDFDITQTNFEFMWEKISNYSSVSFDYGMTLVYVKESVFRDTDLDPLNETLQNFIYRDNVVLESEYALVQSDSETDSSGSLTSREEIVVKPGKDEDSDNLDCEVHEGQVKSEVSNDEGGKIRLEDEKHQEGKLSPSDGDSEIKAESSKPQFHSNNPFAH